MNKQIFEGKWDEVKGKITHNWGKLTNDDLTQIKGNNQQIFGILQQYYGYTKDEASKAVKDFLRKEGYESFKDYAEHAYEQVIDTGEQIIEGTKKKVEDSYHSAEEQIVKIAKQVRQNPLTSLVVAGAVGFLLSSLLGKKN